MIKTIYICDKCGNETEDLKKSQEVVFYDWEDDIYYRKRLCNECEEEIRKLIDNNYMVIDPEELRK